MISIPASINDLTAEWFSSILRLARNTNTVQSVDLQRLGESDSLSGYVYRANLSYTNNTKDNPKSLIVKLPRPRNLRTSSLQQAYEREVRFYQKLAPTININVPKLIYSDIENETGDYVLVLEDFPALLTRSIEAGATSEQAFELFNLMAKLHAQYWNSSKLAEFEFLNRLASFIERFNNNFPQYLPIFLSRFSNYLQSEEMAIFKVLPESFKTVVEPLLDAPQTLVHNDISMKNILIQYSSEVPTFVLIDWAMVGQGPGVRDVSFFIETSIPHPMRSEHEKSFLGYYWQRLRGEGVTEYSFDQLMDDYCRSVILDLGRMVTVGGQKVISPAAEFNVRVEIRGRTGSAKELDLHSFLK